MPHGSGYFLLLIVIAGVDAPTPPRPSHIPLDTGLGDSKRPEDELLERLSGLRKTNKSPIDGTPLNKEMLELAKSLMKNSDFLKSIRESISSEQIEALRERLRKGQALNDLLNDADLQRMLREGIGSPKLNNQQRRLIEKLIKERPEPQPKPGQPMPPVPQPTPGGNTQTNRPAASGSQPDAPPRQEQLPSWLRDRLERWIDDAEKWAKTPGAADWRDFLRRMAETKQNNERLINGTINRARGLGSLISRFNGWVPRPVSLPRIGPVRLPTLSSPSLPSSPDMGAIGRFLVVAVVVGSLFVLLWRGVDRYAAASHNSRGNEWDAMGPLAIEAIHTREQVVQAFERLSLRLLGRKAKTQHHRDLAHGIGHQTDADPTERRHWADALADVYEQARYAPPGEDLSANQLEQARRCLRRLTGERGAATLSLKSDTEEGA